MTRFDLDCFYTLYDNDDGVTIYDSLKDARETKKRWQELVPVEGPFQHGRLEKPLILAARRSIRLLLRLRDESRSKRTRARISSVIAQVEAALNEFKPNEESAS